MGSWKPSNYKGVFHEDPRDELRARVEHAKESKDIYIAIPVDLAVACAELHECAARYIIAAHEEDGTIIKRTELICRKPLFHSGRHSNRHETWRGE